MKVPPLPESDFLNTKTTLCHIKLGAGGGGCEVEGGKEPGGGVGGGVGYGRDAVQTCRMLALRNVLSEEGC